MDLVGGYGSSSDDGQGPDDAPAAPVFSVAVNTAPQVAVERRVSLYAPAAAAAAAAASAAPAAGHLGVATSVGMHEHTFAEAQRQHQVEALAKHNAERERHEVALRREIEREEALEPARKRMAVEAEPVVNNVKVRESAVRGHGEPTSEFHGKQWLDYQGRTFMAAPSTLKPREHSCFLPKRVLHTWKGHKEAVACIRFLPKTAHLVLSASMDATIKIWRVYDDRACMRTYSGHSKAVRDVSFSPDGSRFASAGYDRKVRIWDTETGQVIRTFQPKKTAYVVRFNPNCEKQNELLMGGADCRVTQWDLDTGEKTQEYEAHQASVNTITFFDDNKRFISSSDDKTMRVYEYGIPVVVKYVSDPQMHSMPAITLTADGTYALCQSLDNQILVYDCSDRFRPHRRKKFVGHSVAGYACQIGASTDGKFVASGDAAGGVTFWDFKTTRRVKFLKAHEGVSIGTVWHPHEPSWVATCGWDGLIKLWGE